MKLAASELAMIAQTLAESGAIMDRADLHLFTWPSARRTELADKLMQLLDTVQVECSQLPTGGSGV
jgi:hypothetical protein